MKPFSFYPTASGASKTQPMSASDITRINRIRASSAAYPNILSNPPKNISNLALGTSQIASIRLGNTINNGIFSYNPKPQPVVVEVSNNNNSPPANEYSIDYSPPANDIPVPPPGKNDKGGLIN
jgi:hypothetical protein